MAKTKEKVEKNGHNGTVNRIEHLIPSKNRTTIEVPAIRIGRCHVEIVGTTGLIVHEFSKKSRDQMKQKQSGAATTAKEKRDPREDFYQSMYLIEGDPRNDKDGIASTKCKAVHGIPCAGVKNAMVRAAKSAGAVMTDCRSAFFIVADGYGTQGTPLARLEFDEFRFREDIVRLQGSTADLRYRCEYLGWKSKLTIEYNRSQCGVPQLVNLLRIAGFGVGICEWRPECSGESGRFGIGEVEELTDVQL